MTPQERAAFEALVEAKRLTDQMDTFTDAEIAFVFKESFGWAFVWSPRCMAPYRQGTIEYAYAEVGTGLDKIPGIGISAKRTLTIYGPDLSEP